MTLHRYQAADDEHYDAIVIGSGLGGLSVASALTRAGWRVLVCERHDRPGGYAQSFRRWGATFDAAIHMIGGRQELVGHNSALEHLLAMTGIADQVPLVGIDPFFEMWTPGHRLQLGGSIAGFVEPMCKTFESSRTGIGQVVDISRQLVEELDRFPPANWWQCVAFPRYFPHLWQLRSATVQQVLEAHISDPVARSSVSSLWGYLGLPPGELSFIYWSAMLMSFLRGGPVRCDGPSQMLPDALVAFIRGHGGEVILQAGVRHIQVDRRRRRATGVVLDHGQQVHADWVISNADARYTLHELVGDGQLPGRYLRKLDRQQPSSSGFIVYGLMHGDPTDLGLSHQSLISSQADHQTTYRAMCRGEVTACCVTVPSVSVPALRGDDRHVVSLTTLAPYAAPQRWSEYKKPFTDRLIGWVDGMVPGFADRLSEAISASPRTLERYTMNHAGAMYGWALSPSQVGMGRFSQRTPYRNLRLVGHWTEPGGGVAAVISSGLDLAASMLKTGGIKQLVEQLRMD